MDFRSIVEFFKDVSKYLIIIVIVLFVAIYIISLQQVVGPSMEPYLNDGDVLLLNKFNYHLFNVKRNDVIAFKYEDTKYLVKRVIGLPGENIYYKDNTLYINDEVYDEVDKFSIEDFNLADLGYSVIPDDMYLVLGDNRGNSMDSRNFGLIKKDDIIGKAFVRIWPLNGFKIIK